jgi:hypothetical protein
MADDRSLVMDRAAALSNLAAGDMFHGRSPNRASLICLVTAVTKSTIFARRITTQDDLEFDRQTGISLDDIESRIDCVAPLPPDIIEVFLNLDRKYRAFQELDRTGAEPDLSRYKLTPEEHRALLAIDDHIEANPI